MAPGLLTLSEDEVNSVIDYLPPKSILSFALTCRQLYNATKPALAKNRAYEAQFALLNLTSHPFTDPLILDQNLSVQPPGYHPVQVLEVCLQNPVILKYIRHVRVINNTPQRQKYAQPNADGSQPRTKFFSSTGELHRLQVSHAQRQVIRNFDRTLKFNVEQDQLDTDIDGFHHCLAVLLCLLPNLETLTVCCPDAFDKVHITRISDFLADRTTPLSTLAYHTTLPVPAGSIAHNIHTLCIRGQYVNTRAPEIDLSCLVPIMYLPTLRTLDCEGIRAREDFKWPDCRSKRECTLETWRINWSFLDGAALAETLKNAPCLTLLEYSQPDFWAEWNPVGTMWENPQIFLYISEFVHLYGGVLREEGLVVRRRRIEGLRPHGRFQIFRKGCPPPHPSPFPSSSPGPRVADVDVGGGAGEGEEEGEAAETDIEWIYSDFNDDLHIEFARQTGGEMLPHLC